MIKKLTAFVLSVICVFSVSVVSPIKASAYSGLDYTKSAKLAGLIDKIIDGDINMYTNWDCSKEDNLPLWDSLNGQYFIKNYEGRVTFGWQCYIYANGIYNRLFGEWVGNGSDLDRSKVVISGGKRYISYSMFKDAEIKCGAYIRTTSNYSGSFNSEVGHSMVVLDYNEWGLTYFAGNIDGHGLVGILEKSWGDFNYIEFDRKNRYLCHVVQPTDEFYEKTYPDDFVCKIPTDDVSLFLESPTKNQFEVKVTMGALAPKKYTVTAEASNDVFETTVNKNIITLVGLKKGKGELKVTVKKGDEVLETQKIKVASRTKGVTAELKQSVATYTGKKITPNVEAKDLQGNVLQLGKDYIISSDKTILNVGTYPIDVKFIGEYYSAKPFNFSVKPAKSNITESKGTCDSVKLTWKKQPVVTGYQVYRSQDGVNFENIANIKGSSNVTYTDNSLTSGKEYFYKVRARKYDGEKYLYGEFSSVVEVIPTPAKASLKKVVNEKGRRVDITWNKQSGVTGYQVFRSTDGKQWHRVATTKGASRVSFSDVQTKKGKTYYYKIRARKYNGEKYINGPHSTAKAITVK